LLPRLGLRVADGFDKTAEPASHFVGALNRSLAHPVNRQTNNTAMILIWVIYANSVALLDFSRLASWMAVD